MGLSVPYTFSPNTTAFSAQVNSNFSAIVSYVNTYCAILNVANTFTAPITINHINGLTLGNSGLLAPLAVYGPVDFYNALVINVPSTFSGNLLALQVNGTQVFNVDQGGDATFNGNVVIDGTLQVSGSINASVPPGTILMWGGSTAPTGYFLCQGQSLSTTTYADLFAVLGYTYGGGGSSFNLPNLQGRVPVGLDTGDPNFAALGDTGGEDTHTLAVSEIPANLTVSDPTHAHEEQVASGTGTYPARVAGVSGNGYYTLITSGEIDSATAIISTVAASTGISVGGGGGAHNNLQPYITVNYIIKY